MSVELFLQHRPSHIPTYITSHSLTHSLPGVSPAPALAMSNFSSPATDRSTPTTPMSMQRHSAAVANRRKSASTANENAQAIKVICRFRPVKQVEIERYGQSASMGATNFNIDEDRGTVETQIDYDKKFFTFDRVRTYLLTHSLIIFCSLPSNNESDTYVQICGVDTTQSQLFESVEDVIDSVMEGFNGTILAYGQTSSG